VAALLPRPTTFACSCSVVAPCKRVPSAGVITPCEHPKFVRSLVQFVSISNQHKAVEWRKEGRTTPFASNP